MISLHKLIYGNITIQCIPADVYPSARNMGIRLVINADAMDCPIVCDRASMVTTIATDMLWNSFETLLVANIFATTLLMSAPTTPMTGLNS